MDIIFCDQHDSSVYMFTQKVKSRKIQFNTLLLVGAQHHARFVIRACFDFIWPDAKKAKSSCCAKFICSLEHIFFGHTRTLLFSRRENRMQKCKVEHRHLRAIL